MDCFRHCGASGPRLVGAEHTHTHTHMLCTQGLGGRAEGRGGRWRRVDLGGKGNRRVGCRGALDVVYVLVCVCLLSAVYVCTAGEYGCGLGRLSVRSRGKGGRETGKERMAWFGMGEEGGEEEEAVGMYVCVCVYAQRDRGTVYCSNRTV